MKAINTYEYMNVAVRDLLLCDMMSRSFQLLQHHIRKRGECGGSNT